MRAYTIPLVNYGKGKYLLSLAGRIAGRRRVVVIRVRMLHKLIGLAAWGLLALCNDLTDQRQADVADVYQF
jgi:hypothetical protein